MELTGLGGGFDSIQPPLDSDTFTQGIVEEYGDQVDEPGIDNCIGAAVDEVWPAPGYRAHQREAVIDILHELYVEDNQVVTLSAPTGAGKSLILHAAMATVANEFGRDAFFTTPLNALIDQVDDDEFIADDIITLKGKNNYACVHPQDAGTPVDSAVCQRVDDFDCRFADTHHENGGCPYYGKKHVAQTHPELVTNLSYLMSNSMIPDEIDSKFDSRELLVCDEVQSIEDFALQFVSVTVSQRSVPVVWDNIPKPPKTEDVEELVEWLQRDVMPPVTEQLNEFERLPELTEEQNDQQEDLQDFDRKVRNLVHDVSNNHWVAHREVGSDDWSVEFKPIFIGRFLESFLWSQGERVVLSSATIPKNGFLEEIGLSDCDVGRVEVPSTFPPERRPVITEHTVGKMTYNERDKTIPKMADKIAEMADHHEGERGFVHCRAYSIMERIYEQLPSRIQRRTFKQDPDRREESLEEWLEGDDQIFLSVAMAEGISLDDWRTRWQVIAKAEYPNMRNDRVDYRLNELDDWNWYASSAAIALQQAVGRGMRSKDDHCVSYVLDTSAVQLIERNEHLFESWFLDSVDADWFRDTAGEKT